MPLDLQQAEFWLVSPKRPSSNRRGVTISCRAAAHHLFIYGVNWLLRRKRFPVQPFRNLLAYLDQRRNGR